MQKNAHPDSIFSRHVDNDWTHVQTDEYPDWTHVQTDEYPQPDIRGPMPKNAHLVSTFSSQVTKDWTHLQMDEQSQSDIRGPMPVKTHQESTFSSKNVNNDWTYLIPEKK